MPKPGKSRAVVTSEKQTVATPWELIDAIEARFGLIMWDLAATQDNCRVRRNGAEPDLRFFGPQPEGHMVNALSPVTDWPVYLSGFCWLNPPYADIAPWARRCAEEAARGCRILLLVPASCDSVWYGDYVQGKADVFHLRPRVKFEGYEGSSDRPHMLCVYDKTGLVGRRPICTQWIWRESRRGGKG